MCKDKKINILTHVLAVLITAIIVTFIIKGSGDNSFVDKFSFGSTISSIILSVVAIMYTFVDGSKSNEVNNTLVNSAKKIEGNLNELDILVKNFKGMENNLGKITEINKKVEELICKNDDAIGGWRAMAEAATTSQNEESVKYDIEVEIMRKDEIKLVVNNLTYNTKSKLLLFRLAYENKLNLDLDQFELYYNILLEQENLPNDNTIANEAMIVLDIFSALNLIKFEYINYKIKILQIDLEFIKALNKCIPEKDFMADSAQMRFFGWVYDFFDK